MSTQILINPYFASPAAASKLLILGVYTKFLQENLIPSTPNLEALKLMGFADSIPGVASASKDFTPWTKLKHLDIYKYPLRRMPLLPPTITWLNISDCGMQVIWPNGAVAAGTLDPVLTANKLPLLEYLTFQVNEGLSFPQLYQFLEPSLTAGNLKSLDLGGLQISKPTTSIREVTKDVRFGSVTDLSLKNWTWDEGHMLDIIQLFPGLRRVDLSLTKVTGVLIKGLMTRKPSIPLEWLGLTECHELSSDAVVYARSKGVIVNYSFPISSQNSRAFRERTLRF